eukprot:1245460-Pleurochrysis_carterae.AAC.3
MAALRDESSLNVVIPMGGRGEAFREAGYSLPKPLIRIAGRPMLCHLLDNLKLRPGDTVWLVVPAHLASQVRRAQCDHLKSGRAAAEALPSALTSLSARVELVHAPSHCT